MISRRLPFLWVLALALPIAAIAHTQAPSLSAPAVAPEAPPAAPSVPRTLDVPGGALVAGGKAPELGLLYTGDVIGYIEPCG